MKRDCKVFAGANELICALEGAKKVSADADGHLKTPNGSRRLKTPQKAFLGLSDTSLSMHKEKEPADKGRLNFLYKE